MSNAVESANPVGEDEIAAWVQHRQVHVWARVVEQTRGDGALILGELDPAPTQRGLRLAVVVAVLLPALIVGLVLLQLSDSPSENSPVGGTAVPIDIEVPLTMELPTSGAMWVADASLDGEQAARAFALEAFGWDEGVEISTDEDFSGPTFITMTRSSVSITALFVPVTTATRQWTLFQLGPGEIGFGMEFENGIPEVLVISRIPDETVSIVMHITDGNETTSTYIEGINSSNLRIPLDGWPWAEVLVFVDASGQAIAAVAGESGFTSASPSSVATTMPSPFEFSIELVERDGVPMIELVAEATPDGTELIGLVVNGKLRALTNYEPGNSVAITTQEEFTVGVDVAAVALGADRVELARSSEQYIELPDAATGVVSAGTGELMTLALKSLVEGVGTGDDGPVAEYLIQDHLIRAFDGSGDSRALSQAERHAIESMMENVGSMRWISDPEDWITPDYGLLKNGAQILGAGEPILDDEGALVPVSLLCGSLCGYWHTYRLHLMNGVWQVVGIEGPRAIS